MTASREIKCCSHCKFNLGEDEHQKCLSHGTKIQPRTQEHATTFRSSKRELIIESGRLISVAAHDLIQDPQVEEESVIRTYVPVAAFSAVHKPVI